jgi:ankyrin repeat protein
MALMQSLAKNTNPPVPAPPAIVSAASLQPWMETALFGTVASLKKQLNAGLDPNSQTPEGTTVLMMAAHDAEKVKLLVGRGAIVSTKAKSGFTALMVATTYTGTSRSAKYLLDHGAEANPGKGVQFDATPLYMAALAGDTDNLDLLLAHGADPNHKMMVLGMFPSAPLFTAVGFGDSAVVATLLKGKANVHEKDDNEMTPLHWAALAHRVDAVKTLLAAGADVNAVDKFGYTPLQYAATLDFGDAAIVTELLKAGANPNIKDKEGKTAQERGKRLPYVTAALEQAGAKR